MGNDTIARYQEQWVMSYLILTDRKYSIPNIVDDPRSQVESRLNKRTECKSLSKKKKKEFSLETLNSLNPIQSPVLSILL